MLTVPTYLAHSEVHGIGLFAGQDIAKGDVVWKLNPYLDVTYTKKKFLLICETLDPVAVRHFLSSCYVRGGKCFYITDNARFINHSEADYNVSIVEDTTEVATKAIRKGEEILENYFLCYDQNDFFIGELELQKMNLPFNLTHLKRLLYAKGKDISRSL